MTAAHATFSAMVDGTAEDWQAIEVAHRPFNAAHADRIIEHLLLLKGQSGYAVDRFEHSLQTATRAFRGGEGEAYVVCALLHDIGDSLAYANHPDIGAAILKPFVSEDLRWMVEHHGIFQGYYFLHHFGLDRDLREKFRGHPHFEMTARFCEIYDQNSFDAAYDTMPLDAFVPLVRRVFSEVKNSIYKA